MSRRRLLILISSCLVLCILFIAMQPITVGTESRYTCTQCRAERVDKSFLGLPWQSFRDTPFSEWYKSHRPAHTHSWGWQGAIRGVSLLGLTTYRACGRRHPVSTVPEDVLQEYCEQADDSKLAAYFAGITSADPAVQERTAQAVLVAMDKAK
jgi:hypothetical protein